jgi:hypothetical protein
VQHDHPSVVLLAYPDDIHLLGTPKDVGAAHEALVKALKEVKLEWRPDKCYVWSPSEGSNHSHIQVWNGD